MKCGESVSDVPDHLKPFARNSNGIISEKAYDQNNRRMHPDRPLSHDSSRVSTRTSFTPFTIETSPREKGLVCNRFQIGTCLKGNRRWSVKSYWRGKERWSEKFLCQYNQIGNAVPPLLAKAVATHLLEGVGYLRVIETELQRRMA